MGQICSICGSQEEAQRGGAFAETSSPDDQIQVQPPSQFNGQPTQNTSSPLNFNNPSQPAHVHGSHLLNPGSVHGELDQRIEENDSLRRLTQYRLEQVELARREAIVTAASQSMVPVGSTQGSVAMGMGGRHRIMNHHHSGGGGINTYYDPSYAAAAAQDILRSAAVTGGLVFYDDKATQAAWNVSVVGSMPMPASSSSPRVANSKDVMETLGRGRWDGVRLGSRGSGLAGCGGENPEYYLDDLAEAFLETVVPTKTTLFGGCASIVENLP